MKKWIAPELITLIRQSPEELILQVCKNGSAPTGEDSANSNCAYTACSDNCDSILSS